MWEWELPLSSAILLTVSSLGSSQPASAPHSQALHRQRHPRTPRIQSHLWALWLYSLQHGSCELMMFIHFFCLGIPRTRLMT